MKKPTRPKKKSKKVISSGTKTSGTTSTGSLTGSPRLDARCTLDQICLHLAALDGWLRRMSQDNGWDKTGTNPPPAWP